MTNNNPLSPEPGTPRMLAVGSLHFLIATLCTGGLPNTNGDGPQVGAELRDLLRATYLRPLRDAARELSAGRGSRLSHILTQRLESRADQLLEIMHKADKDLESDEGVSSVREQINTTLKKIALTSEELEPRMEVLSQASLRHLLEKLDLKFSGPGRPGLGSENLLFIACELLLGEDQQEGLHLLLIEEPEAHLHPQRQLRLMKFLQETAEASNLQVIVTTHSPNLASVVKLDNLVVICGRKAFSMARNLTKLDTSDYAFLERFLDVTKANLFFARGVVIVEGHSENILLPTLASLIDRDFTHYGVSVVNVGSTGLRRFARIFQRHDPSECIDVPVACVTDFDVMPAAAREVVKKNLPIREELSATDLQNRRSELENRASGQRVKTFVSDQWTLEYDLAYSGLARDVYAAAKELLLIVMT